MRKKLTALVLVIALVFTLSACGSAESGETQKSGEDKGSVVLEAPPEETTAPIAPLADTGELGDVAVAIGDFERIEDYYGNPAILIHFSFTNNSEENKSAMISLDCTAFQNGIGLKDPVIMDESIYNSSDFMKEIQPGATIELTEAYLLSSETAPVEFIVSETISFSDSKLGKTYEIDPSGVTVMNKAPGLESAVELDRYAVSINSYNVAEDYDGNKALILNMGYTNNSSADTPFYAAIDVAAFQDGIELEQAFITDDAVMDDSNNYVNVLPGAGLGVSKGFVLSSETSPIDIEISAMFSFSDDKITTKINLAE